VSGDVELVVDVDLDGDGDMDATDLRVRARSLLGRLTLTRRRQTR
jgi:hypothetical protein